MFWSKKKSDVSKSAGIAEINLILCETLKIGLNSDLPDMIWFGTVKNSTPMFRIAGKRINKLIKKITATGPELLSNSRTSLLKYLVCLACDEVPVRE
mmetsp:Transcript_10836/g.16170  ORF Transcript_10836/g.16170 Transcript_10836/m.16170 type:complete len:97 (-) Transcript_10836:331-621(-)